MAEAASLLSADYFQIFQTIFDPAGLKEISREVYGGAIQHFGDALISVLNIVRKSGCTSLRCCDILMLP